MKEHPYVKATPIVLFCGVCEVKLVAGKDPSIGNSCPKCGAMIVVHVGCQALPCAACKMPAP